MKKFSELSGIIGSLIDVIKKLWAQLDNRKLIGLIEITKEFVGLNAF